MMKPVVRCTDCGVVFEPEDIEAVKVHAELHADLVRLNEALEEDEFNDEIRDQLSTRMDDLQGVLYKDYKKWGFNRLAAENQKQYNRQLKHLVAVTNRIQAVTVSEFAEDQTWQDGTPPDGIVQQCLDRHVALIGFNEPVEGARWPLTPENIARVWRKKLDGTYEFCTPVSAAPSLRSREA